MMLEFLLISMYITGVILFLFFIESVSLYENKEPETSAYLLSVFWCPFVLGMVLMTAISLLSDYIKEKTELKKDD